MALNTVLDSLDGVDDAVKAFYVPNGDKFVLDIEGVDAHPTVTGLKGAYAAEQAKRKELAAERDALKQAQAAAKEKKADEGPDLAKVKGQYDAEIEAAKQEAAELRKQLFAATVQRDMSAALAAAGVTNPAFAKGAMAILSGAPIVDGKVQTDMGPMEVGEYVKKWATTPEGAAYVTPAQGGGAKGSGTPAKPKTIAKADFDAMNGRDRAAIMATGVVIGD